ncbi:MAG: hypothetical protein KGD63_10460 [Candidatus Lokiarchaeota archaeon]|nr:hypothetical protein [Candidatus Lokiarchaeota archaeon]
MPNRFCAICGKEINAFSPHFSMCYECYLEEHPLFEIPDKFSFKICLDCLKYNKKEEWFEPILKDIDQIIEDAIQRFILKPYLKKRTIDFKILLDEHSMVFSSKDLLKSINVNIIGTLNENEKIMFAQDMQIVINYELCKNCVNLRGGSYFLSIIQLRVVDEQKLFFIEEVLEKIESYVKNLFLKEQRHYISKISDEKNGVDLYLSTNEIMNYIISFLRGNYHFILKRSKKLVGRDIHRGKNLYRLKSLIKFLPFRKKDTIIIKNKKFKIDTILKNKVILKNESDIKITKDFKFFFNEPLTVIKEEEVD